MLRELVLGAAGAALSPARRPRMSYARNPEAPVGAPCKAVLRVPHGCEGTGTIALRICVPDG
jgi:uncharacterized protein YcnI